MTAGYLAGVVLVCLGLFVCFIWGVIALIVNDDWGQKLWYFSGSVITAIVIAGIFIGSTFPPFEMKYHSYRAVNGQVTSIGTRLLGQDKSTTQEIVLSLRDKGDYRCDDTRCSLVKIGDTVDLQCIGVFELHGTSGWRCNYVDDRNQS